MAWPESLRNVTKVPDATVRPLNLPLQYETVLAGGAGQFALVDSWLVRLESSEVWELSGASSVFAFLTDLKIKAASTSMTMATITIGKDFFIIIPF